MEVYTQLIRQGHWELALMIQRWAKRLHKYDYFQEIHRNIKQSTYSLGLPIQYLTQSTLANGFSINVLGVDHIFEDVLVLNFKKCWSCGEKMYVYENLTSGTLPYHSYCWSRGE